MAKKATKKGVKTRQPSKAAKVQPPTARQEAYSSVVMALTVVFVLLSLVFLGAAYHASRL